MGDGIHADGSSQGEGTLHGLNALDLMVVVAPGVDASRLKWDLAPRLEEIADEEGESPVWFSVLIYDRERLRERRRIRSFFLQEVDRDKLVLVGDGVEGAL